MRRLHNDARLGRFNISMQILDRDPEGALVVMEKAVILEATYQIPEDAVHYLAWSPLFRELQPGEAVPWYRPIIGTTYGVAPTLLAFEEVPSNDRHVEPAPPACEKPWLHRLRDRWGQIFGSPF